MYFTYMQPDKHKQISFEDLLAGKFQDGGIYSYANTTRNTQTTIRHGAPWIWHDAIIKGLKRFIKKYEDIINEKDKQKFYTKYSIPKKSGGRRTIQAPCERMKEALTELSDILTYKADFMKYSLAPTHLELKPYHTTAFAYIEGRSTIDAVKRHQKNESKWFAKLDFHDFFGSTTEYFVHKMIFQIFPWTVIGEVGAADLLKKALSIAFLNGGLPQGSPASPAITNIMMIPIDFMIANTLRNWQYTNRDGKLVTKTMVYTRYADDMIISSRSAFDVGKLVSYINGVIKKFDAPFTLNHDKTRYGSSHGSNWNLGVMLNKDNNITIGHENKKVFKAMLNNYIMDRAHGIMWDIARLQHFKGLISYYEMVEGDSIKQIIQKMNKKYNADVKAFMKADLKALFA